MTADVTEIRIDFWESGSVKIRGGGLSGKRDGDLRKKDLWHRSREDSLSPDTPARNYFWSPQRPQWLVEIRQIV
ncbi:hypothetical protein TNCV_3251471 [Trichonephila clavipes]|nr:hypothetical protein TNCV_3251471 [Trichonephila clavipes]